MIADSRCKKISTKPNTPTKKVEAAAAKKELQFWRNEKRARKKSHHFSIIWSQMSSFCVLFCTHINMHIAHMHIDPPNAKHPRTHQTTARFTKNLQFILRYSFINSNELGGCCLAAAPSDWFCTLCVRSVLSYASLLFHYIGMCFYVLCGRKSENTPIQNSVCLNTECAPSWICRVQLQFGVPCVWTWIRIRVVCISLYRENWMNTFRQYNIFSCDTFFRRKTFSGLIHTNWQIDKSADDRRQMVVVEFYVQIVKNCVAHWMWIFEWNLLELVSMIWFLFFFFLFFWFLFWVFITNENSIASLSGLLIILF